MGSNDQERIHIHDRKVWRKWLDKNHARKSGVWLVFHKKKTGKPSLAYEDAVEEALCFGWIDSQVKRVDNGSYVQKFTPRKATSTWSASNKKRARKMISQGRMTAAGLRAIEEAKQSEAWNTLEKVDRVEMAPVLKTELARNKRAREQYERIPMSQKKQFLWWIVSAKREETKMKRTGKAIELLTDKKSMSDYFYGRRKSTG
jgi:uncharacterized protein YdeI (YjbR/CyaY-like superfamily)